MCRLTCGFLPALWGSYLLHASPTVHPYPLTFFPWTLDAKGDDHSAFEFEALVSQRLILPIFPKKDCGWVTDRTINHWFCSLECSRFPTTSVSVGVGTLLSQLAWTQGPCVVVWFFHLSFWKWKIPVLAGEWRSRAKKVCAWGHEVQPVLGLKVAVET